MKVFYVFSQEDGPTQTEQNWSSVLAVFPDAIKLQGSGTILDTYRHLSALCPDGLFVWIDGDNTVLPEAVAVLNAQEPSIFMSRNCYDIVYGHGGIKVCRPGIAIRDGIIDVTWYLGLKPVNVVASVHNLGTGWIKHRAIFVEMIKNALKGDSFILNQWCDSRPDIWQQVERTLNTHDIDFVIDLIRYRSKFREYYENSLCSHM